MLRAFEDCGERVAEATMPTKLVTGAGITTTIAVIIGFGSAIRTTTRCSIAAISTNSDPDCSADYSSGVPKHLIAASAARSADFAQPITIAVSFRFASVIKPVATTD